MTATKEKTCRQRWAAHKNGRMADFRKMIAAERNGNESGPEDTGPLNEYGLCLGYVIREDGPSYWRYQLSTGGPGDELRFFASLPSSPKPYRVEYWFLDWFDGYGRALVGKDFETAGALWYDWASCEWTKALMDKAIEEN